ncbi:Hypothetical Protein OBI_RACECAR_29 [Arthrobacter phage Racecar]|nr:hypothetical protein PBI_RACECAR_110 [Arthrobacter phage Racecar]
MIISGITCSELAEAVAKVNAGDYDGNIVIENCESKNLKGTRISVKLGTADSRKHGSRRAWSGRHGKWLCWHGFRDVFRAVYDINEDAVIRTGKAVYKGRDGFESVYRTTGDVNVGSMFQPAYMPEMCVGTCAGDWE